MSDMKIVDHGAAAVVTCQGTYEGPQAGITLKFNARLAEGELTAGRSSPARSQTEYSREPFRAFGAANGQSFGDRLERLAHGLGGGLPMKEALRRWRRNKPNENINIRRLL
jgi:hypothetical protein